MQEHDFGMKPKEANILVVAFRVSLSLAVELPCGIHRHTDRM